MRRALRWLGILLAIVLALPVLAALLAWGALNTGPGRRFAEQEIARLSGGTVQISGLAGFFPDALRVARLDIRDDKGAWLTVRDAALDWAPSYLFWREARITHLTAAEVSVTRLPTAAPQPAAAPAPSGANTTLPLDVVLDALRIDRLSLSAAVAGAPFVLAVEGNARLDAPNAGSGDVSVRRLDGGGTYRLIARANSALVTANLVASEPAHGLLSDLAGLPDLGAVMLTAAADGPWSGISAKLVLTAGALTASADGRVDVPGQSADLDLTAHAPAMAPRADLSWQSVQVQAHVHGPWLRPQAQGTVAIDGLRAAGATLRRLAATVQGDLGKVSLTATAEGVRLPGSAPDLLAAAPVTLRAEAHLDDPARPVTFTLSHPLLTASGAARTAGTLGVQAHLELPDLAPFAALGIPPLQGHAAIDVTATLPANVPTIVADGVLALGAGPQPLPGLLGPEAHVSVTAALQDGRVEVSRLQLDGKAMSLAAHGSAAASGVDVAWQLGLPDLSVLAPTVHGTAHAAGRVHGKPTDMTAEADLAGDIATAQVPRGPIKVSIQAHGLPDAPTGTVTAEGSLDGAPLSLDVAAGRQVDGALSLHITRADWKSLHAEGALNLAPAATLPAGRITLRMARLADLSSLLGQKLAGSVVADLSVQGAEARLRATATNAALAATGSVSTAALDVKVADPLTARRIDGTLALTGLNADGIGGTARLAATGTPAALALQLRADLTGVDGQPLQASATARLDVPGKTATISALQAAWQGETLHLLAPVSIAFGNGLSLDRARIGLSGAVLQVAGKVSPTLDLTASLRNLPADLVHLAMPNTRLAGTLQADAKLSGTVARPEGRLHLAATGLHLRAGPGAAMPPAAFTADATLAGASAQVTVQARAGKANTVSLAGTAPLDRSGAMNLRATGHVDLAVLDPLLSAEGRRVQGQVSLDATLTGTAAVPRADGSLRLTHGDVEDFAQGLHLADLDARIEAAGDTVRIVHLTGKAGPGSIAASGTVGLGGTMPVTLTLTAKQARPLATDLLTANLNMDLALRGDLLGALAVSGDVTVNRADIRIPERLPATVAVLDVRRPGQKPPPPPAPGPNVALNVTLRAPGQVFVRGRGLDAELQGRITLAGTAAALQPSGRFTLRRGTFNLAGQTLTFSSGEIGFDGSRGLDPTLNFVATSTTSTVTATLTVTGYASAPKFVLSSSPELPQDEVLAQLLFHQSASNLSGLQLAQAAAALAQVSGVGGGFDPLNSIRAGLGLDRLSVGSSQTGNGATLEAGRYVAPRIYVGAKQGSGSGGTQALVQFDVTRRLKLQATAGTGGTTSATGATSTDDPSGSSIGLTYQFDY